jgi:internalin A
MSELALQLIEKEKRERTGKLDLGNCGLTDFPEELFELEWLEELSLMDIMIDFNNVKLFVKRDNGKPNLIQTEILPIGFEKFQDLKTLNLSGLTDLWNIKDCGILSELKKLQKLFLGANQISDIQFVKQLHDLECLNLSLNNIADIRAIEELRKLHWLDLSSNQVSNINFLERLTNLESLDLSSNQISNINILDRLKSLQFLSLSRNQIKDCSFLGKLIELQSLKLSGNPIEDYNFIEKLTLLKSLVLNYNKIHNIRFLEKLIYLNVLELRSNHIFDYSVLKKMKSLQSLDLSSNHISEIRFLENLTELQSLFLRNNQISYIHSLRKLTSLKTLDLRNNKIRDISGLFPILKKGLPISFEQGNDVEGIFLYENPISNPPKNIIKQGREAILDWFEQIEKQGKENLYEARIVIVGESGAGKTTLYNKLDNENILVPDPDQKSTHGININYDLKFKHGKRKNIEIKSTIWDFGGQDIQTYLHQYFYAKDNLFVLVCDHRSEKTRFDYWFEVITRLCEDSRIIVVRNQNGRKTASQSLKLSEYEKRFPRLKLSSVDVDFRENDARWNLLIQTIEDNLSAMDRVNEVIPSTWKPIREKIQVLKEEGKHYIGMDDFQSICSNAGLLEENYQEQCLNYLHWLGYALHYDDSALLNTIFIDPQWITTGLYEILREENYKPDSKGRFSQYDIQSIWKGKQYSSTDRNHLLNLLLKDRFEVCYKVENSDNYLVPILISNNKNEPEKPTIKPYVLRFKFPFMPYGFFSRLIVRLYENIWDDYVWLTGVWLRDGKNCSTLLEHFIDIQTGDEVFEVSIYGSKQKRKELLSEIRNEIFHIRKLLFPNLIIQEQIPCPCNVCVELQFTYFHNRNELEKMIERNQFYSQCKNSGDLIPTGQLLDSIIDMEEFKKQIEKRNDMDRERIKIELSNIGNPEIHLEAKAEAKAKSEVTNTITISIQNILGEVEMLKEDVARELKIKKVPQEEIDLVTSDIEVAETALKEMAAAQQQNRELPVKSKNRLKRFIDDLGDEQSTLHKGLKLLRKGKEYGVKLAELYNTVAANTGMPMVPSLALEVIKKL